MMATRELEKLADDLYDSIIEGMGKTEFSNRLSVELTKARLDELDLWENDAAKYGAEYFEHMYLDKSREYVANRKVILTTQLKKG